MPTISQKVIGCTSMKSGDGPNITQYVTPPKPSTVAAISQRQPGSFTG